MYRCPLCQHPLQPSGQSLRCQQNHQFDFARESYVNLLPVQQKKSLAPGDNTAMMQARRAFLEAGHYAPLSDAVNQWLSELLPPASSVLDIGCGEGYYSGRLAAVRPDLQLQGLDISKAAVRYAAKKYRQQQWCVASSYALPFMTASFHALLRIYAPSAAAEMVRVLQSGGYLLAVSPAPQHLLEFKQRIYTQVRLHSEEIRPEPGLRHIERRRLSWPWQAPDDDSMLQLMDMIPLAYKLTPALRADLCRDKPAITLDFYLDLYQKY